MQYVITIDMDNDFETSVAEVIENLSDLCTEAGGLHLGPVTDHLSRYGNTVGHARLIDETCDVCGGSDAKVCPHCFAFKTSSIHAMGVLNPNTEG